jgi:hypothetical protein
MTAVRIVRLSNGAGLPLPSARTPASAGLDLAAAVGEAVVIPPGGRALIPTGFAIALPPGAEGQIRPRSGLAVEFGVTVLNAPGTIDADYRVRSGGGPSSSIVAFGPVPSSSTGPVSAHGTCGGCASARAPSPIRATQRSEARPVMPKLELTRRRSCRASCPCHT